MSNSEQVMEVTKAQEVKWDLECCPSPCAASALGGSLTCLFP